jgi:hypothetical protein
MTTVSIGGAFRLVSLPRKNWPQSPPFLSEKDDDHPTQIFKSRRTSAENLRSGMTLFPEVG